MKYKNLVFLGTSHIAKQSLDEVKSHIENLKPDIIALELDKKRLPALMSKKRNVEFRMIKYVGLKGFLFAMFGAWAEKKLGKLVGVAPGSEMKQAVKLAKKHNIELALVDQDIQITLRRFSQAISWKEKWRFVADIVKAPFSKGEVIKFDLRKVPEKDIIRKLTDKLKERYPNVYKVLITERNGVIASNLKHLINIHPNKKILVILGAGHIEDVVNLLSSKGADVSYSFSVS
jgi:pheromone shutdown-related protein TraB